MREPLRVAALITAPQEIGRDAVEHQASTFTASLRALESERRLAVQRVIPATEKALTLHLAGSAFDILHIIGEIQTRNAANYGTVVLEGSDRRPRGLNATYLARYISARSSLRLVVIQPIVESPDDLAKLTAALVEGGAAGAVATSHLSLLGQRAFLSSLYATLCSSGDLEAAVGAARRDLASTERGTIWFHGVMADKASRPQAAPLAAQSRAAAPAAGDWIVSPAIGEIARKRALSAFDVFLCHNLSDKPAVKLIGEQLKSRGILPWLDEWELPPGQPWQTLLETQMGTIKSAAVFIGAAGIGPWQQQEIFTLLDEFVGRRSPVIPVLLPNAPQSPSLPRFLRNLGWVDFRRPDPDPLGQLIWGITGVQP